MDTSILVMSNSNASLLRQTIYLGLAVVGLVWAWTHGLTFSIDWLKNAESPYNVPLFFFDFFYSAYIAGPTSAFLTVDLLGAWFTFLVFVLPEAYLLAIRHGWVYFLIACTLGVCFAMPLFLFNRERVLQEALAD